MNFLETLQHLGGVKPCPDPIWPMPEDYTCCCGIYVHPTRSNPTAIHIKDCPYRPVLDLAPLLADTGELTEVAHELLCTSKLFEPASCEKCFEVWAKPLVPIHVIGPQRASNLVYEVARQLGGTTGTVEVLGNVNSVHLRLRGQHPMFLRNAEVTYEPGFDEPKEVCVNVPGGIFRFDYHNTEYIRLKDTGRLPSPIPPNVTILFVTDRVDNEKKHRLMDSVDGPSKHSYCEMQEIIHTVAGTATRPCPWKYLTSILCLVNARGSDTLEMPYGPHEGEWKIVALHKE